MRVLFHHRTRGQGAEGVHILGVTNGLRQLGHQVSLLSLPGADPEQSASKTSPEKARRHPLKGLLEWTRHAPEWLFELFELSYNLVAWYRLRRAVKRQSIQCIYERYSLFMVAGVVCARQKKLPIILEVNDSCLVERVRPLFFKGLARRIERWIFQHASGLVFISGRFQSVAKQAYKDLPPSVVSPNGADLARFHPDERRRQKLRQQLGVQDKVVLGYVGAFVHWHGIDWFVDMMVERLHEVPDLVLLLVGDGYCFEAIEQRVQEAGAGQQVIMTGRLPHEQVVDYLAAMDLGILPDSNDYGSPMKLFEFMAMGKAMVAPDYSPIEEVVEDGETGWLFPAGDRQACIEKVLVLAGDRHHQQKVGENARDYIKRERQWHHNAQQLMGLLDNTH
ncbi:Alpha-D-kanosaminyltransferase [Saliniradius amylolyticus]|uniref:Alpha-D-kanosaminyltransferase n=1 Tax=Saliniradius amylolyticus TaxID=2183582 RepID=A0A2S2E1Y6_9ALTE|nr:glycosyltransferase family 4 protein [Saliniradius amylolyticus]AWL11661.1 Alpha-D-kanosaminyltransferase [Saliniradius amylolyticus]